MAFFIMPSPSSCSSSWPTCQSRHLMGPSNATARVASHCGGRVASAMALVCVIFIHEVHALVDVVSGSESSTDSPRAGLDWRDWEKREINEAGNVQQACQPFVCQLTSLVSQLTDLVCQCFLLVLLRFFSYLII